jgi:hypothetical protein
MASGTSASTAVSARVLDGARLAFSKNESGIITMPDGTKARVTVEIKVNGVWKAVEPSKIPDGDLENLAKRCQNIYNKLSTAGQTKSLTVYFQQTPASESFTGTILGKFFDSYKNIPAGLEVTKIEYQTNDSDTPQVMELKDYKLGPLEQALQAEAMEIADFTNIVFANREALTTPALKPLPGVDQKLLKNGKNLEAIKQVLNVQEAGSQENRCATLSVASILLKRKGGNLKAAANEFDIPLNKPGTTDQITLSNGLIELATQRIESDPQFTQPESNQLFSNIIASLNDARQNIPDSDNRKAVVEQYANLIRQPGQMLDVPIFDALQMQGIPFITLVPNQTRDDFILGSVSGLISFDADHSIDTYDLTNICFVVREGLHYRAIIMNENPNLAQGEKLRSILRNDMNKTLGQIATLAADSRPAKDKWAEMKNLITSVVTQYPADAKPIIIQKLPTGKKFNDADISEEADQDAFILATAHAFLNPT